jgi:sugar lactone lactonase YvrE
MSVADDYEVISVTSSGASIRVDIPWDFEEDISQLIVSQQNIATGEVEYYFDGAYTVTVASDEVGIYLTVENYFNANVKVVAKRDTPKTQTYNIAESAPLNPTALTAILDKLMRLVQEANANPFNEIITSVNPFAIGSSAERANKVFGFDENGDPVYSVNLSAISAQSALILAYCEEWANKAEDSLVSEDAGGNGSDEYSAKHHALKALNAQSSAEDAQTAAESAQAAAESAESGAVAAAASILALTPASSGTVNSEDINQTAHSFVKYDAVYHNGTDFSKALADDAATANLVGIVSSVADADNFTLTYSGLVAWDTPPTPDYTLGSNLFLSNVTAGLITDSTLTYIIGNVRQFIGTSLAGGLLVNISEGSEITATSPSWTELTHVNFNTTGSGTPFALANSGNAQTVAVSGETAHRGIFVSTDGTKVFLTGEATDAVRRFSLSTPYDISTISAVEQTFSTTSETTNPQGVVFTSDGLKMYIMKESSATVYEYSLSTEWDLTTCTYTGRSKDVNTELVNTGRDLAISPTGDRLYVVGTNNTTVHQWTLTGGDVTTASDYTSFTATAATTSNSMALSADGTRMLVATSTTALNEYLLSTPWDVSTASSTGITKTIDCSGASYSSDGLRAYACGAGNAYDFTVGNSAAVTSLEEDFDCSAYNAVRIKGVIRCATVASAYHRFVLNCKLSGAEVVTNCLGQATCEANTATSTTNFPITDTYVQSTNKILSHFDILLSKNTQGIDVTSRAHGMTETAEIYRSYMSTGRLNDTADNLDGIIFRFTSGGSNRDMDFADFKIYGGDYASV